MNAGRARWGSFEIGFLGCALEQQLVGLSGVALATGEEDEDAPGRSIGHGGLQGKILGRGEERFFQKKCQQRAVLRSMSMSGEALNASCHAR